MNLSKVGIDVKWYFSGPPSGIVVVKNLLHKVLKLNSDFHFFLFIRKDEKPLFEKVIQTDFQNIKIDLVTVGFTNNFLQNLFIIPVLARRHNIDVMVYMSYPPMIFRRNSKNIVFILDVLDLDYPQFFGMIERAVFRFRNCLVPFVDHVLTISYSEKERIHRHLGIDNEKISVIHLGVNEGFKVYDTIAKEYIRNKYNLPEKYILYIGRLNIRKNIPTLVESLRFVKNSWPLVLIGAKDGKTFDIDSRLLELGLSSRVIFLGYVEEHDMTVLLSGASIFCYPSFAEGFGLPPLEAMKSGTPVITTNSTSIPEVCGDAVCYFDPNSPLDLGKKIHELIENKPLREALIRKGLIRVKDFTWDIAAQSFDHAIKKLI